MLHCTCILVYVILLHADSNLTCSRVLAALDGVKDYVDGSKEDLETCLDIPYKIRKEMREQSNSVIEIYREKIVEYWLMCHPNASWESLAGKLLLYNQNQAVEKVKRNIFKIKKGIFWCYCKQVAITLTYTFVSYVKSLFYCFNYCIQLIIKG